MQKILRLFLASGHKHRIRTVSAIIWVLRLLHDVELDEMRSNEDMLENLDSQDEGSYTHCKYDDIEELYLSCEYAQSVLNSAIDDLEYVY